MEHKKFEFDGDFDKLKKEISKLPIDAQEQLKDLVETLKIRILLKKGLRSLIMGLSDVMTVEELMKSPTFTLITLLEATQQSNVDELMMATLQKHGILLQMVETAQKCMEAEESARNDYKDKEGTSVDEVLKQYLKNQN